MANLFSREDRRVVPNWRSFEKTAALGELDSFQLVRHLNRTSTSIEGYIADWKMNGGVIFASDLLSAATVNNKQNNSIVKEAAEYVLKNRKRASYSQVALAQRIIYPKKPENTLGQFNESKIEVILSKINMSYVYEKIRRLKSIIKIAPSSSIAYVELSRYYSILGQEKKAVHNINLALNLSPNNRFILRAATRLYTHFATKNNNYLEKIHWILRQNTITKHDPWLLSAEIAVATILQKYSRFIKRGMRMISSNNVAPFAFTELASGIATVELLNGRNRKSKALFKKALINPNDNTLAQIEWAATKDSSFELNPKKSSVKHNFEAMALDSFQKQEFEISLENSAKWLVDMPFSKRPVIFASNLASTILEDHEKSIAFLKAGQISHPHDPVILNNLAYAYAQINKTSEALAALKRITNHNQIGSIHKICITATLGLIMFRDGEETHGRRLYRKAIEQTKQTNHNELEWIAILNHAREEILVNSEYKEIVIEAVSRIPENSGFLEVDILKKKIVEMYKRNLGSR